MFNRNQAWRAQSGHGVRSIGTHWRRSHTVAFATALRRKPGWRAAVVVSVAVPIVEILFFIPAAAAWHDAGFTGYLATLFGWFAFLAFRLRRESNGVTVP